MPAGDLVTQEYDLEIRTTVMGPSSTGYDLEYDRRGVYTPLGVVGYKSNDVALASGDGSVSGADRKGPRVFTFPIVFGGTSANAGLAIQTMETAWAPSTTDIPLYHWVPGVGKFYANGRPRGLGVDAGDIQFGVVRFLAVFVALDSTYTEV